MAEKFPSTESGNESQEKKHLATALEYLEEDPVGVNYRNAATALKFGGRQDLAAALAPVLFYEALRPFAGNKADESAVSHITLKYIVNYLEIRSAITNPELLELGDRLAVLMAKSEEAKHCYSEAASIYHEIGLISEEESIRGKEDAFGIRNSILNFGRMRLGSLMNNEYIKTKPLGISEVQINQIISDVKEKIRSRLAEIDA